MRSRILERYGIDIPPARARGAGERRASKRRSRATPVFAGHEVHLIATPQQASQAAAAWRRARAASTAHILSDEIEGESREVGKVHAALARQVARRGQPFAAPCVILSGGETTVTVRRQQRPRRPRHRVPARRARIALHGEPGVYVLAADTDGIDGIEDNAGAIVTPDTLARARAKGLEAARRCSTRNDAVRFFETLGDLVVSGPTFTNVNDFRAMLVFALTMSSGRTQASNCSARDVAERERRLLERRALACAPSWRSSPRLS